MGVTVKLKWDAAEWLRAVQDYARDLGKDYPRALNTKLKDLAFRTAKHLPIGRGKNYRINNPNRFTSYSMNQSQPGGWTWGEWSRRKEYLVEKGVTRKNGIKVMGRGFMKSGTAKAAYKLRRIDADSRATTAPMARGRAAQFRNSRARTREAINSLVSQWEIEWDGHENITYGIDAEADAQAKTRIARKALTAAMREATEETRRYIEQKVSERAAKYSAKGGA